MAEPSVTNEYHLSHISRLYVLLPGPLPPQHLPAATLDLAHQRGGDDIRRARAAMVLATLVLAYGLYKMATIPEDSYDASGYRVGLSRQVMRVHAEWTLAIGMVLVLVATSWCAIIPDSPVPSPAALRCLWQHDCLPDCLVCYPEESPATICFKWILDIALVVALVFGLCVAFVAAWISFGGLGGPCGRRMLLGAEDMLQGGAGWFVGQDLVRLEACGRPFIDGDRAMMAAAVEAPDSDWWYAVL